MKKWLFNTIYHPARIEMGLTVLDYCVLDIFYKTQTHPDHSKDGWASNSYSQMARFLGITKGAAHGITDKCVELGYLEVNPANTRLKRTTSLWYEKAYEEQPNTSRSENERSENERDNGKSVRKMNEKRLKSERHINYKSKSNLSFNTKEEHADKSAPPVPDEPEKKEPPKSKKKSQRKKVAPKKEKGLSKVPSLHSMAKSRFEYWHKIFDSNAAPIYWDGKEIGQLKNMINRLKDAARKKGYECDSDEDFINNIFDVFCKKFIESGAWYADCFVPSSIVSKWNTIIQTLHKNGQASKKTNQGVTSDFKQRQYDILNRAKQQAAFTG